MKVAASDGPRVLRISAYSTERLVRGIATEPQRGARLLGGTGQGRSRHRAACSIPDPPARVTSKSGSFTHWASPAGNRRAESQIACCELGGRDHRPVFRRHQRLLAVVGCIPRRSRLPPGLRSGSRGRLQRPLAEAARFGARVEVGAGSARAGGPQLFAHYLAHEPIFGAPHYTTAGTRPVGCVLAEMLRGRPWRPGENGVDQLAEIFSRC